MDKHPQGATGMATQVGSHVALRVIMSRCSVSWRACDWWIALGDFRGHQLLACVFWTRMLVCSCVQVTALRASQEELGSLEGRGSRRTPTHAWRAWQLTGN